MVATSGLAAENWSVKSSNLSDIIQRENFKVSLCQLALAQLPRSREAKLKSTL